MQPLGSTFGAVLLPSTWVTWYENDPIVPPAQECHSSSQKKLVKAVSVIKKSRDFKPSQLPPQGFSDVSGPNLIWASASSKHLLPASTKVP